jgi:iron complex outermembrane recepter protein
VFWDVQNLLLEDVERIEVISGPGGTLWGTNAVNGVINVITRSAKSTQGTLIAGGGGNRDSEVAARYGGAFGDDGNYRVYGTYFDRDNSKTENGNAKDDARYMSQGGFRTDWNRGADQLMVEGNVYGGAEGQPLPGSISISGVSIALGPISLSGGNLNGRWERQLDDGSSLALQAYYDRTDRTVPPTFSEKLDIVDLQFQHSIKPIGMHSAIWGAEYRRSSDRVVNGVLIAFLPANVHQQWTSLFAQDEITLREDLRLTVGARLERNDYTGNEFLPTVRIAWKVAPEHLLWAAATRTVRAPARLDRDTFYPGTPPFLLAGGPDFQSEIANVYEVGYRGQIASNLSYSVTVFHSDYDRLRTQEVAPSLTFLFYGNGMEGKSTGVEMWGTYQASAAWRLSAGFSGLREKLTLKPGSLDTSNALQQQGRDPAQSWMLRSSMDLPYQTEVDLGVRHVSALTTPTVPAYTAVDLRYGWRPNRNMELSITAQNLFRNGHAEFSDPLTRSVVDRNVFFKAVLRF